MSSLFGRLLRLHSSGNVPLENFFTEAVCLDLSDKPLKSDISIADLQAAEKAAGVTIDRIAWRVLRLRSPRPAAAS